MYDLFRSTLTTKDITDSYYVTLFKANSKAKGTHHLNLLLLLEDMCLQTSASVVTDSKKCLLIWYVCDFHPAKAHYYFLRSLDYEKQFQNEKNLWPLNESQTRLSYTEFGESWYIFQPEQLKMSLTTVIGNSLFLLPSVRISKSSIRVWNTPAHHIVFITWTFLKIA